MFGRSSGRIDLPSMPATLARIMHITNSPDATSEQVARMVMLDQSLSTKVLRLANSAYYGRRTKIETITEAVSALGFSSVRNLAASASVIDALFPKRMFPGFSWQDMWFHSVATAVASEAIYSRMSSRTSKGAEAVFVSGLLHDVGKLIVARALPQRFLQIVVACSEGKATMTQAENAVLSTNHSRIGLELAKQWEFPDSLCAGIGYHHSPDYAADGEDVARAVCAGNLLAKGLGKPYIVTAQSNVNIAEVIKVSQVPASEITAVVEDVKERLQQSKEILSWGNKMPGANRMAA